MKPRSEVNVGLPQEWIRKKRDGGVLSHEEIQAFVKGVTAGTVSEAQIAAFSMAVYFQDLNVDECVALTMARCWTSTAREEWETRCP